MRCFLASTAYVLEITDCREHRNLVGCCCLRQRVRNVHMHKDEHSGGRGELYLPPSIIVSYITCTMTENNNCYINIVYHVLPIYLAVQLVLRAAFCQVCKESYS